MASLEEIMIGIEQGLGGNYCQASLVQVRESDYVQYVNAEHADVCIIVQGPIKLDDDFTLETVKLYRRWYPRTSIVVSTWDDAEPTTVQKIRDLGVEVILNEMPVNPGNYNINCQLESTKAGILWAKKHAQYEDMFILKTRTDQRFTNHGFLDVMKHFVLMYPSALKTLQKGRILTLYAHPHIVGFVSDFMSFGYLEDMEKMWVIEQQTLSEEDRVRSQNATDILDVNFGQYTLQDIYSNLNVFEEQGYRVLSDSCAFPEVYIAKKYMNDVLKYDATIDNYMKALKYAYIIADMKMLGFYWRKGSFANITRCNKGLFSTNRYEIMYSDWLFLFNR